MALIDGTYALYFAHYITIFSIEFAAITDGKHLVFVLKLGVTLVFLHFIRFHNMIFLLFG
jgi:hypothetical protein